MRLLCVCTGNTCRSPMLMALIRAEIGRHGLAHVTVASAGTAAADGEPASAHAVACMASRGLDLDSHRSRNLGDLDLDGYDRFLCMTSSHAAALRSRGIPAAKLEVVHAAQGGVPDPFGGSRDDYEACAQVLETYAKDLATGLGHLRS
jgi:protein-tyrosine phosphatase